MRDIFLRDAKVSQFELFVWCANLAAFFCNLSNAFICPSLYGSEYWNRRFEAYLCKCFLYLYYRKVSVLHRRIPLRYLQRKLN